MGSNYIKFFIYHLTSAKYFWPLVSVYFLTLPNAEANQIGIYVMAAYIGGFILEIPSGYLGDRIGHKTTLIFAQMFMGLAALAFGFGYSIRFFVGGAILMALGKSLMSGTQQALFHEILEENGKDHLFANLRTKMRANIALIGMPILIIYPWIGSFNLLWPFLISAGFHFIGMITAFTFSNPKKHHSIEDDVKSVVTVLKDQRDGSFYYIVFFFAFIGGLFLSDVNFREPFVMDLGLALSYVGLMTGGSRLVMWILSYSKIICKLDKLSLKQFMLFDLLFIGGMYLFVGINGNAIITSISLTFIIGYRQSRKGVIFKHLFATLKDKNYKATMLSIHSQLESLIAGVAVIGVGQLMNISFGIGYSVLGIIILVILPIYLLQFNNKL